MLNAIIDAINANTDDVKNAVNALNKKNTIYCQECCTRYVIDHNGNWYKHSKPSAKATFIHGVMRCTCGEVIGFVSDVVTLPGEVHGADRA